MKSKESGHDYEYNIVNKNIRIYASVRDYTFLKYLRLVMKWGMAYSKMTPSELELLLYLYAEGRFTRGDFSEFKKVTGVLSHISVAKLVRDGWIRSWGKTKQTDKELFLPTNKAVALCNRMHKMLLGEEEIPETSRSNPLLKGGDKTFLGLIKKMNKDNRKKG